MLGCRFLFAVGALIAQLVASSSIPYFTEKELTAEYEAPQASEDLIMAPPAGKTGAPVAIVFAQGCYIDPRYYRPLGAAIQAEASFPIWFSALKCIGGICAIPLTLGEGVKRVVSAMEGQGLPKDAKLVFSGHSLGGSMMPAFAKGSMSDRSIGMVLMGSFLTHDYKTGKTPQGRAQYEHPLPTLTIGGELDGLARPTRIAESLYSQVILSADVAKAKRALPVTFIQGLTHQQVASGLPTGNVKSNDLRPEISNEAAHRLLAVDTVAFITALRTQTDSAWRVIETRVSEAIEFVSTVHEAFNLEGYSNYLPPCLCETKDEYGFPLHGTCKSLPNCTGSAPWTEIAQQVMGGGKKVTMKVTDSQHSVSEERPSPHLPHIHGNKNADATPGAQGFPPLCKDPSQCTLDITTVTENVPPSSLPGSLGDTGFFALSAQELRAKMVSRQAVWEAAGIADVDFTESDGLVSKGGKVDLCRAANDAAIAWAMTHAPSRVRERYQKFGQTLQTGPDVSTCVAGPCWIYEALKYTDDKKAGTMTVVSISFATENKQPFFPCGEGHLLPCDAGFHYCKLLSPARALEWMMVDGLKLHYGINNATEMRNVLIPNANPMIV